MIHVSVDDIAKQHLLYMSVYKSGSSAPLLYESYVGKTYPVLAESADIAYPREIKIPKDETIMLQTKDVTPAKIIRLNRQPARRLVDKNGNPTDQYVPLWYGNSSKNVNLRFGYRNGDSRYLSTFSLGDSGVHMFLGGATGHGKSVALNNLILNMCEEYAPWEVSLTLIDPKIVEFKAYAMYAKLPHISMIGATSDSDYVISVLQSLVKAMRQRGHIFALVGAKKIEEFRKITGLAMPRNIIVMDEVQTTLKNAGRKAAMITSMIDSIARLGRSNGYHIIMASQEIGSEIGNDTLANIQLRGALGCTSAVSQKILGRPDASAYYGKPPGTMLVSASSSDDKEAPPPVQFKVPFLSTEVQKAVSKEEMALAEQVGFQKVLDFYDEEDLVCFDDFDSYVSQFPNVPTRIYLGEPSCVTDEKYKVRYLDVGTIKSRTNIFCVSYTIKDNIRLFELLKRNFLRHGNLYLHNVLCLDDEYEKEGHASQLCAKSRYYTERTFLNNNFFGIAMSVIKRRKLLLCIDSKVFENPITSKETDDLFYQVIEPDSIMDTETNRSRCYYMFALLTTNVEYMGKFNPQGYKAGTLEFTQLFTKLLDTVLKMYKCYGCSNKKLEKDGLPFIFNWVLGIDLVIGIGRDSKMRNVEQLKVSMQDASEVNVLYILFSSDIESVRDLCNESRWVMFEDLEERDQRKIAEGVTCSPERNMRLAMFWDRDYGDTDRLFKYKKTIFNGELL